jgi:hypothetical protein
VYGLVEADVQHVVARIQQLASDQLSVESVSQRTRPKADLLQALRDECGPLHVSVEYVYDEGGKKLLRASSSR